MFKKIVFLLMVYSSVCVIKAQTYKPFDLKNIQWNVTICQKVGTSMNPYLQYDNITYTMCDDSVMISSKRYRSIYSKTQSYSSFSYPVTSPTSFYGYFRQDSLLKRSYLRLPTWSVDSLLMDYNLSVGDTIKRGFYYQSVVSYYSFSSPPPVIVTSIVNQNIGSGMIAKCFYTTGTGVSSYFIEGGGHTYGIFRNLSPRETYTWPFERCSQLQPVITTTNCISIINSIPSKSVNSDYLNIHPNPSSNFLNIDLEEELPENSAIQLINIMGQVVQTIKITNQKNTLNVSDLSQGFYFLNLNSGNKTITKKILIEH